MTEHTNAVRDLRGLSVTVKAVLFALASRADQSGGAYPSFTRLLQDSGISNRTTLGKAIRAAEAAGLLRVDRRGGALSKYTLTLAGGGITIATSSEIVTGCDIVTSSEIGTSSDIGTATGYDIGTVKRPMKKPKKKPDMIVEFPDVLDNDEFRKTWQAFILNRKQLKKPATDHAQNLLLRKFAERPAQAIAALNTAIERGWSGFEWAWLENARADRWGGKRGNTDEGPTDEQRRRGKIAAQIADEWKAKRAQQEKEGIIW